MSLPLVAAKNRAGVSFPGTQVQILEWEPGHVPGISIKLWILGLPCKIIAKKYKIKYMPWATDQAPYNTGCIKMYLIWVT